MFHRLKHTIPLWIVVLLLHIEKLLAETERSRSVVRRDAPGTLYILIVNIASKLQTLVYDILPSTTAVFSYAIGSSELSANEPFFLFLFCAQKVVGLLQTTQIKQGVSFIAVNKVHLHQHK